MAVIGCWKNSFPAQIHTATLHNCSQMWLVSTYHDACLISTRASDNGEKTKHKPTQNNQSMKPEPKPKKLWFTQCFQLQISPLHLDLILPSPIPACPSLKVFQPQVVEKKPSLTSHSVSATSSVHFSLSHLAFWELQWLFTRMPMVLGSPLRKSYHSPLSLPRGLFLSFVGRWSQSKGLSFIHNCNPRNLCNNYTY